MRSRILLIEDDAAIRLLLRHFLQAHGFVVEEAQDFESGLQAFRGEPPDAALIDYLLPGGNALELLPRLREIDAQVPLVVLTAHGSIDLAVRAIRAGAENFLTKPIELEALLVVLNRLLEGQRTRRRQVAGDNRMGRRRFDPFLGESAAIRELAQQAARVAASNIPVLLLGETGSGKGVLARWLHEQGERAAEPFVDLNCAGLSREFLETELFGHEKGAFTGALAAKPGLLEIAHLGTVFLDEIGDVDPAVQPKLLKVLEEKRFRRLGGVQDRWVDLRLIAATHRDLARLAREGRFRSDLYFRISAIPLAVPSLRDRVEDIPPLARALLKELSAECGRPELALAPDAFPPLQRYRWPGNLRELRNVLERSVLLAEGEVLGAADLRFEAAADAEEEDDWRLPLIEIERRHIERVFVAERRRAAAAAQILGIPKSSLYQKLKKFGIPLGDG